MGTGTVVQGYMHNNRPMFETKIQKRFFGKGKVIFMKKVKHSYITAALLAMTMSISAVSAYADEITVNDANIDPVDAMERLASVQLESDENTINLTCADTYDNCDQYYISIYKKGSIDEAEYIVKYLGPIRLSDFKITGLEGGNVYYVLLSSLVDRQNVNCTITTSTEETGNEN